MATAQHVIKFTTQSEVERYAFKWFAGYQLVSFLALILTGAFLQIFGSPELSSNDFFEAFSAGIVSQSRFYINFVILRIAKNFFDLSQFLPLLQMGFQRLTKSKFGSSQRRLNTFMFPAPLNTPRMLPAYR